ncbi:response regulator transcription factor [Polymorphobacter fuscus]|uniref:Response regulator n=1 Tax=Sandarakinorhabdus fusca TaxID=1439888 RepID=A0A7C9GMA8_9SPHN|nr:response regulator [Polymorphobacter fuscus]KAB7648248.1 response regulator transcription factor [Polymorphobacter fuscus]MQT15755.1 response regulator [Polymorphobacter fuscus]NJC07974.1 FixJ family two-component response regulator [Polymorphobacter fuscus]
MTDDTPLVVIIDDDEMVTRSLDSLFRSVGMRTVVHGSAQAILQSGWPAGAGCMVVDIRMPQIGGLEFQAILQARGDHVPIVFMTGHGDIPMTVQAMKAGAVDFLAKPFRDQDMLDAVGAALARDRARRETEAGSQDLQARYERLTARERQVIALVCSGLMNKQVAGELGIQEITVKLHRSSVMRKMGTRSLADLVRCWEALVREGLATPA